MNSISKEYCNPKEELDFEMYKFKMWPNFKYKILKNEDNYYLQLISSYKFIRYKNCLETINEINNYCQEMNLDVKSELKKWLIG